MGLTSQLDNSLACQHPYLGVKIKKDLSINVLLSPLHTKAHKPVARLEALPFLVAELRGRQASDDLDCRSTEIIKSFTESLKGPIPGNVAPCLSLSIGAQETGLWQGCSYDPITNSPTSCAQEGLSSACYLAARGHYPLQSPLPGKS